MAVLKFCTNNSALLKVQEHDFIEMAVFMTWMVLGFSNTQHLSYISAGKVNISRHALVTVEKSVVYPKTNHVNDLFIHRSIFVRL